MTQPYTQTLDLAFVNYRRKKFKTFSPGSIGAFLLLLIYVKNDYKIVVSLIKYTLRVCTYKTINNLKKLTISARCLISVQPGFYR